MQRVSVGTVGIREFREQLSTYLESAKPVAITRHGATIGYYIPVHAKQSETDALRRAGTHLDAMLERMKTTEDEIVAEFKAARRKPSRVHAA